MAACADSPGGKLAAAALEPIQVVETRRAVRILQPTPGRLRVRHGPEPRRLGAAARARARQAAAFCCVLPSRSTPTARSTRRTCARAQADGHLHPQGRAAKRCWEPRFTYHGFRYVQVEGYPGVPTADDVVARVVRSAVAPAGSFACSSELFNRIDRMVRWTEASNLHGVPTDCPQRDERMGWLNDLAARSEEAIYNFDMARLFAKWVDDIADAQDPRTGAITDTAPFRWGRRPADPVSVCYLQIPWLLYVHYGDITHAAQALCRHEGLGRLPHRLRTGRHHPLQLLWRLGAAGPAGDQRQPGQLGRFARHAGRAGLDGLLRLQPGPAEPDRRRARTRAKSAPRTRRWRNRSGRHITGASGTRQVGGYGSNNQSCNAISLYMDMVPPQCTARVVANLVRDVVELHDCHLTTGNICTKYLLEALTAAGHGDVAYSIATQETYPSWGYMLANGATTLWERWELATGSGMNSHNHPMLGSVGSWLYRAIGGIRADEEGPALPRLKSGRTSTRACSTRRLHAQDGAWRGPLGLAGRRRQTAADGTRPGGQHGARILAGCRWENVCWSQTWWSGKRSKPVTPTGGIQTIVREDGVLVCTVGSGEYHFAATLPEWRL